MVPNSDKVFVVSKPKSRRWMKNAITATNNLLCYIKEDEPERVAANADLIHDLEQFAVKMEERFVYEY